MAHYGAVPVHGYQRGCLKCEAGIQLKLQDAWAEGFRAGGDYQDFWRIYEEYGYEPEPEIPANPYSGTSDATVAG